jgi:hypothetical protein
MNKTNGRKAINHILTMMQEDEHIDEDFKDFIDSCISDYLYEKKLSYSLISVLKFRTNWIKAETFKEINKLSLQTPTNNSENNNQENK